jgi:peptidyl-prolyl cis-trans isomerase C
MRVLAASTLHKMWARWWITTLAVLMLAACTQSGPSPTGALGTLPAPTARTIASAAGPTAARGTPAAAATAVPRPTITVTPTPEPLAARVNGDGILLAALQKEVERCRAGLSSAGADVGRCPDSALQSLIEQRVVEQAAVAAKLTVTDEELNAAEEHIQQSLGGADAYAGWLAANLYTRDEFRQALRADRLRAKMADQVMASVGPQAEQVHALALVVADEATAQDLLAQIRGGADFSSLALKYSLDLSSRATGGDLGWFPRGVLAVPEVEAAAFALKPGETSEVIHSAVGYHLVQVLEIDPARPLSPAARQTLRARAYQTWLEGVLSRAVIEKLVSP